MSALNHLPTPLPVNTNSIFEQIGLKEQVFKQAIGAGLSEYLTASKLAPLNAGGSMASFKIIETLRHQLLSNRCGWKMKNLNGLCLTINSGAQISLVTTSGDKYTGLQEGQPCTKNGKGCETKNQICQNIGQNLSLFEDDLFKDIQSVNELALILEESKIDAHELWVLLYYFDNVKKEVRYELSLPIGFKDVGKMGKVKVSQWRDRVFFSPIPYEAALAIDEPADFSDEFEFTVTPKLQM
ncbi:hypothetical protein [Shewanella mangrovisoli]|uniref:hypothetical protein n=1 Tax=Shewanella mangrovisoli TaxID=2864211 RepID=UPI0035BA2377